MEKKGDLVGENSLERLGKTFFSKLKRGMNL